MTEAKELEEAIGRYETQGHGVNGTSATCDDFDKIYENAD